MALYRPTDLDTGVVAEYHKAIVTTINPSNMSGTCRVHTYLTHQTRLAGKRDLCVQVFRLPVGTFTTLDLSSEDARTLVYAYLKTLDEFSGAVDV